MKTHFNKNLVMTEEEEHFNKVIIVGSVKNLSIMIMKRLEILVTLLQNSEEQQIGIVT